MKSRSVLPLLSFVVMSSDFNWVNAQQDIGFVERFALAEDRAEVLNELIPGTDEAFYYRALHLQNERRRPELLAVMAEWGNRFPNSASRELLTRRQALIDYETDPKTSLEFIREKLNLTFNHQRQLAHQVPNLPSTLDPQLVTYESFLARNTTDKNQLSRLSLPALEELVRTKAQLTQGQRRDLLGRLERPDIDGLTELIITELKSEGNGGFGAFPIYTQLLPDQLDALATAVPALRGSQAFVTTRLAKLAPNPEENVETDLIARGAWLDRLWEQVRDLPAALNSLKAHILHQRLDLGRMRGVYDQAMLIEYLKLPRPVFYINPLWRERTPDVWRWQVDLNADFRSLTLAPPIGGDEPMVRDYLLRLLVDAADTKAFEEWVEADWLKQIFAEAKITAGKDPEGNLTPLLSPSAYGALKERVDIEFDLSNQQVYGPEDEVSLDVWVKNVPGLMVKVFEINTTGWFETHTTQIGTDIDLDGLVAGFEEQMNYNEPPLLRVKRTLKIPAIPNKRGVWVVELIGNGRSSRALVRKGGLHFLPRRSTAGHLFVVLDERRQILKGSAASFGGRRFESDSETGEILIPFSTAPGMREVVLHDGQGFASLERMQMKGEVYQLNAAFHLERESVLLGGTTAVAVRPRLLLNEAPVSIDLLMDPRLVVTSSSQDGVTTTMIIDKPEFKDDQEFLYELKVPNRVRELQFELRAQVRNLSNGRDDDLVSIGSFGLNESETAEIISDLHLGRDGADWFIEHRGKNGELLPNRAINLRLQHRFFREPRNVSLKTDEKGRVNLGKLDGLDRISATTASGMARDWPLQDHFIQAPGTVHAAVGEVIRLPWFGTPEEVGPKTVSLLETRAGSFVKNWADKVTWQDGYLSIEGLDAGDYSLQFRQEGRVIHLSVAKGERVANFILAGNRMLETTPVESLHLTSVLVEGDLLVIRVKGADSMTRLHVAATRYAPVWRFDQYLGLFSQPGLLTGNFATPVSRYVSGRDIGEEYRYILDRQMARVFPGVMLPRPGLLLNPWAVKDTIANEQEARSGEVYQRMQETVRKSMAEAAKEAQFGQAGGREGVDSLGDPRVLDWLAEPSAVSYNLEPDAEGFVKLKLASLGDTSWVHVMAINGRSAVSRDLPLPAKEIGVRDLRLADALPIDQTFAQRDEATALIKAEPHVIQDALSAEFETYGDLGKVFTLLKALNPDDDLDQFSFVIEWPTLTPERKRELYSKHTCHELSFFVSRKDPEFFASVVKPYLANKKDRTFMDDYLLEVDLSKYLDPWRHGQLNIVERILLGHRINPERDNETRHIRDLLERVPVDRERDRFLLETALRGLGMQGSLAANDEGGNGLDAARSNLNELRKRDKAAGMDRLEKSQLSAPTSAAATPPSPFAQAPGKPGTKGAITSAPTDGFGDTRKSSNRRRGLELEDSDRAEFKQGAADAAKRESDVAEPIASDSQRRTLVQNFFRALGPTKEWAENNYWELRPAEQNSSLVTVNRYWKDFAEWDGKGAFVSARIIESHRSFTEIMLALSVLDLPFPGADAEPAATLEGQLLTLTPKTPLLLFQQQVRAAEKDPAAPNLLVSQNFYRAGERYLDVGGEKIDKFVKDEFLAGVVYGCQMVVTNPTSSVQKLDVLFQIPQGALPVAGAKPVRSFPLRLEPYRTETLDVMFYFPKAGNFVHHPVQVSKEDRIVASAEPFQFKVVNELSGADEASWDFVSQEASKEQVIAYLDRHNLEGLNLDRIAWRVRDDGDFFRQIMGILRSRRVYSPLLFSYGIQHNDADAVREFLLHQEGFLDSCGPWLDTRLVKIDPIERKRMEFLEYEPLVNARVHQLGATRKIMNQSFRSTYIEFLNVLAHKPAADPLDRLAITYYLLVQDRVEEALNWFGKVRAEDVSTNLQFDYYRAWLAMAVEDTATARTTAAKHATTPVDKWRTKFTQILAHVNEMEGKGPAVEDDKNREQTQGALAALQPTINIRAEGRKVILEHRNIATATVNYYRMNLEFLFSTNPFVGQDSTRFSVIQPNKAEVIQLDKDGGRHEFMLPQEFQNQNILVEVIAAGQRKTQAVFASDLKVDFIESYGIVQVRNAADSRPLSKVYVKVYAEIDGKHRFFKDGYTDLRGKFDYVSLNTGDTGQVTRFSVLVLSPEHGAIVKELQPPVR